MSKPAGKSVTMIVAALVPELGIGYKGTLPWKLRQEMKYFKNVTSTTTLPNHQNAVIMGRKTWDSIPEKFRPLPGRINIVLSRRTDNVESEKNIIHASSIDDALNKISKSLVDKVFIIGGAEIYNQLVNDPQVKYILLTEIKSPRKITMDTFLEFPFYTSDHAPEGKNEVWTRSTKEDLQEFIGSFIDLPNEDIVENDFTYNYSLWTKK